MPSFSFMLNTLGSPIIQMSAESRDAARELLASLLFEPEHIIDPDDVDIGERERLLNIINSNEYLRGKVEAMVSRGKVELYGLDCWVIFDSYDDAEVIRRIVHYVPSRDGDFWNYIRS